MKKQMTLLQVLIVGIVVVALATFATARITGYLYGDALIIGYPGTTTMSVDNSGNIDGATLTVASVTVVSAYGLQVSSSATSATSIRLMGSVVTLSTQPATVGEIWYQSSNSVLYVSTRVPAANVTYCAVAGCYAALH